MSFWFWYGVRHGIRTTRYPAAPESAPGVSPGRPVSTAFETAEEAAAAAASCPVNAITASGTLARVELRRCVHCQRCRLDTRFPVRWEPDFEWAAPAAEPAVSRPLPRAFSHSLHVMVVDAGDCGACLREVRQLNNPLYNVHRLGLFFTATPRTADVLLVVGPVSANMRGPLMKTYEAMPEPRRVMAVGACALSGGVFGRTFMSAGGVGQVLPVDLEVPGEPPPPLAIVHGLLQLAGRAPMAPTAHAAARER
jgi:Ni,Fe-hydrogenase III small subunit